MNLEGRLRDDLLSHVQYEDGLKLKDDPTILRDD